MALGILAGITLVYLGKWQPLTPWLLLSFILIGAMTIANRTVVRPWALRVRNAIEGDSSPASLNQLTRDKRALMARLFVIVLFSFVTALMMSKPALA